ncbi:hypothetical protein SBA2_380014 [Acidobacteriia bacterium SbA2]|nr:hypothetical protein SBA2_380014 [Acidobacteriia bacterium SbA2]
MLLAPFNREPSIGPVLTEIVGDVENLHLDETHTVQRFVRGPESGAMTPGAAATIQNDELLARQTFHAVPQLFHRLWLRSRANVSRARDMSLSIERMESHVDQKGLNPSGRLEKLCQVVCRDLYFRGQ